MLINYWRIISIRQGKLRNIHAKFCAFGPEKTDFLKIFKKILRFFDQNLYGKLTFFVNIHENSSIILAQLRKYYLWKITLDFYNKNLSVSGGGDVPPVPPPYATAYVALV